MSAQLELHPDPGFHRGLDEPQLPTSVDLNLKLCICQGDPDIAHEQAIDTIYNALEAYGHEGQQVLQLMTMP